MSAAWPSGSERRFYDGRDRKVGGSTPTQALLHPWIRCFTIIISAWWNLTSTKIEEVRSKTQAENSETRAAPKRVRIRPVQHGASVVFS